jgi:serine/threonine-protein kinase RsbW
MAKNNGLVIHNKSYPSIKDTRKMIIEEVVGKIHSNDISLDLTKDELYLVIDEALTNAMEHGNSWDPSKQVSVLITLNTGTLDIRITDEGLGFTKDVMEQTLEAVRNLKPRGRGIFIIKQFCNPSWNEKGNQIDLHFTLQK